MTSGDSSQSKFLDALVSVAGLLLTDVETRLVMERMAGVLAESIPDVVSASVTVQHGSPGQNDYRMVAASDAVAEHIDEAQYNADAGPCVSALVSGREICLSPIADDGWPAFAAAARARGVDWSLSVPMEKSDYPGVLNIYGRGHDLMDEERHLAPARVFARYAATILAAQTRYHTAISEVEQLQQAMASRATIEQAKGMIMLRERCSADDAFQILVHTSQRSHQKLRDIAAKLVASVVP